MTAPTTNPYLSGNYAPIPDEVTFTDLEVVGTIPEALDGRYLRTGPNPHVAPPEPHHWFVGDGMIHGVELQGGKAKSYRNRWVRTDTIADFLGESRVDGPKQPLFDASNTNVLGFAGNILSLTEGALPYLLDRDLNTIGRFNTGDLPRGMTAHPKIDPRTKQLVGFSYGFAAPHIYFHTVEVDGTVSTTTPVDLPRAISMHDFAITPNYVLFFDQPYVFDLDVMATQGFPFRWAPEFGARLGVMPRNGSNADITWIETDTCYCFHPMNAYEDADANIVVDIPKMNQIGGGAAPAPDNLTLERWTADLKAGVVKTERLDDAPQEFCRINEAFIGEQYRYGYAVGNHIGQLGESAMPYAGTTIFKHDFEARTRADHDFGADQHPGEFVFVADPDRVGQEDGGWMMGMVTNEAESRTDVVILDAQDFSGEPLATVKIPRRVPYGFHGNWVASTVA